MRDIKKNNAGFNLLEILIAIVVLSVGLLGLASLQMQGSDSTNGAYYRSQASLIANELAERMHINRSAVDNNDYAAINIINSQDFINNTPAPRACDTHLNVTALDCNSTEMATFDIYHSVSNINDRLPTGTLTITCNDIDNADADVCSNGSVHTINVSWNDVDDGNTVASGININVTP